VGATTSKMCFKELAASTTAGGRRMIMFAKGTVEETYPGTKVIYGDTDSIFINFMGYINEHRNGKTMTEKERLEASIQLGMEATKLISSKLKRPLEIAYEKTFWPFAIFTKKRYVGNKYETNPDKFKQASMGIVLKRRDNAPIVKTIYSRVLEILLNDRDVEAAKLYYRNAVEELLSGKFPMEQMMQIRLRFRI
jgi:DNA polymerase elongation subunit (family B)